MDDDDDDDDGLWTTWCDGGARRTVDIHLALGAVEVTLLGHDDVLDVLHGQVVAERVVQETLQLVHGQLLHVALETQNVTS